MTKKFNPKSIVLDVDSYKVGMFRSYPEGTTEVYSYITARGGKWDEAFYFGLQAYLRDVLSKRVTKEEVEFGKLFWEAHGEPFPYDQWMYIVNELDGKLPLCVKGLDEGTMVPHNVPMVTVHNTDPKCYWLTTWVETSMLRAIWYPTVVGTKMTTLRKLVYQYLEKSSDDLSGFGFKVHDFSSRGTSSNESATLGDMAVLATGVMGTDTAIGILSAAEFYDADVFNTAFSIVASEHSIACAFGPDNEAGYIRQMLKHFETKNIVAMVSDAYNIYNFVDLVCEMKDEVIEATKGGKLLVIRPDSNDPVEVLSKIIVKLATAFGTTTNSKGYKILNNVRLIWGDGINQQTTSSILRMIVDMMGYSSDNLAFGQGGEALQIVNRDDLKFAMKASAMVINGKNVDVFKDPLGAPDKRSLKGKFSVVNGSCIPYEQRADDMLQVRFLNSELFNQTDFVTVRKLAAQNYQ